jgi:3-dehydro-4-phosphotetronate decarboxylase
MSESLAREEICRVGLSLFQRGYVHATAGNISVKLEDGALLITPSDACLGFLDPALLARIDTEGKQTAGLPASKTLGLHLAIHRAATAVQSQTRCVIHTHSTYSVALSLRGLEPELLPPITPYFVMKVGHVPVIAYHSPGDPAAADAVVRVITDYGARGIPLCAVMLERLGPNVWHDSPAQAMAVLEELEETARLICVAREVPPPLSPDQIDQLRRTFGSHW